VRDRTHAVQARKVLEVRALVVDSRSACVAVGSPPPGARACARARLREARIFPFASGRPIIRRRGGRSSAAATEHLRRSSLPAGACESLEDCLLIRLRFFYRRGAASVPRCENPPPRASHRVARGASRFAASLVPRRLRPALRTRVSKAASRPAEMGSTMHATQAQLKDAKVDLAYRDFCAHLLIPLNECRKANYFLPWRCEHDRHVYEKCQYKECVAGAGAPHEGVRLANPPPAPTAPPQRRSKKSPAPRSIDHRSPPRAPSTTPPSAPSESLRAEPLTPRRPPRPPEQIHDARLAAEGRPALKTGCAGGSTRRERRRASSTAGGVPTRRDGREKKNSCIEPYNLISPRLGDRRARPSPSRPFARAPPPARLGVVVIGARAAGWPSPLRFGSRASRRRREMKFLSIPGGGVRQ
jgi:NADH dehydrogenase (ubiquinone) 1 beta subcomplex subunit 7